ncbi:MAG TPA: hypothetical protein DCK93_21220 [Blastocatellia bacterium]|nr:hypothetical protein [Blastocatellia bacterium]
MEVISGAAHDRGGQQAMPRLNKLEDVLFPVKARPVFVSIENKAGERMLPVRDKKAIVNLTSQKVLGIVSRGYRLVTNREALDWAHECCRTVFPETQASEWEVKATDAPSTGGHCQIDLVHNSTALDFSVVPAHERPDTFGPFIRVTNSYNALRALAFDVGFFRKVCKNGMIVPESIIRFKFSHQHRDIGETVLFEVARDRLGKLRKDFGDYLSALRTCEVPRADFEPFVCNVLFLRQPEPWKPNTREANEWKALMTHLSETSDHYAHDLGQNAYAIFNVITEFASQPPSNRCVHRDRHSLQKLAGAWVSTFSQACRQPGFSLATYLAPKSSSSS